MDYSYTQDRELSWLKFNERVLDEVKNKDIPLLERLKFLEIYTNNLDEFYMVRVGTIYDMSLFQPKKRDSRSDMTPAEQLAAISHEVRKLEKTKILYYQDIMADLEELKIHHMNIDILGNKDKEFLQSYFELRIFPFLTPMVIGKQHPFPHIPNKELHIVVSLSRKEKRYFGIVPVPGNLERVIYLNNKKTRYILLEELITYFCDSIFANYTVEAKSIIAVTRSADIDPDDDMFEKQDDYIEHMKNVLKVRGRLHPLRVEVYGEITDELTNFITSKLDINKKAIFADPVPINLKYFYDIIDNLPEEIKEKHTYGKFIPAKANMFQPGMSVTKQIQQKDRLLFFPYESIDPFLQLLRESSEDKDTISIKITIYRLAKNAKIVDYLCKAAENGKDVLVLMELRARFDEKNNINYSKKLEDAGVTVIYGMENYKVHSKICLITKKNHKGVSYITQIGTGNYNETTSKIYTDFSLLTASRAIGEDAVTFFHNMTMFNLDGIYEHLLVAPSSLKSSILDKIRNEVRKSKSGLPCGIFMKMNSLTDRDVINALKDASVAGVPIFLLIRGICCIRSGIAAKTENIKIESIVGRFLEHTRIYVFGDMTAPDMCEMYISSADMMTRNTERRVEVAVPIYDMDISRKILDIIACLKKDNVNAQVLQSNDTYKKKSQKNYSFDSQEFMLRYAKQHEPHSVAKRKFSISNLLKTIRNKI